MTKEKKKSPFRKFWDYLWHSDSIGSYILNFLVAFLFIKFIFFPAIGFALSTDYPIVAIVSGSMEHKITNHDICDTRVVDVEDQRLSYDQWWEFCGDYYVDNFNITKEEFNEFPYDNGLNIGDVMILYGKDPDKIDVGDVLVFIPEDRNFFEQKGPVIHRVVEIREENSEKIFQTKGDHNPLSFPNFETEINEDEIIGVGVVKIPFVGYAKIMLNELYTGIIR